MKAQGDPDYWRSGRQVIYKNTVHLVFTTKYRKKVFDNHLLSVVEATIKETCLQMKSELIEFNGEDNHVHMIVQANPRYALSNFVGKLKGKAAYILRRDHMDKIKPYLWGGHFWSPSYCVVSTGGASLETVMAYIQKQDRPS